MDTAARARQLALAGIEVRATQSQNTGSNAAYNELHPHVASGPTGGQFAPKGSGIGDMPSVPRKSSSKRPPSALANTPQAPTAPRTMKPGDSGEDVRYAQYAMNLLGFKVDQSGNYDQATADAVKQIQERLGVKKPNGHLSSSELHKLQDAVRLSPCIGAGQRNLGFEAQWEARDTEETDGELDEDTEALIAALGEFIGDDERSFNEALHPRNPKGSVGGGRFRSITDRIVAALSDWKHGTGPDDPLKDFSREQLLKAAKAHGHTFRRGASIEEIKAQILDDVRNGTKAEKAAAPHLPGAPAEHRRFTIQHAGIATDVGIFGNPTTGKLSLYRESDTGKRTGRAIKSFDDMAALESWARANGHTELADYAKAEQTRTSIGAASPGSTNLNRLRNDAGLPSSPSPAAARVFDYANGLWDHRTPAETSAYLRVEGTRLGGADEEFLVKVADAVDARFPSAPAAKVAQAVPAVRDAQVENRIRTAYAAVKERNPGSDYVMLSDLRKEIGNAASQQEVDAALKRLAIAPDSGVNVVPQSNQKALTAADRAAAVHFGGQDKHAISIDKSSDPLAGLEGLTTVQKRAALRKRGLSKAEIDGLVPLEKTALDPLALAQEVSKLTDARALAARLGSENLGNLRQFAKLIGVPVPPKMPGGGNWTRTGLSEFMAIAIVRDRDRFHWRSSMLATTDLMRRSEGEGDEPDPDLAEIEAWAEEDPDDFDDEPVAERALGHDVTPGHDELHHYWTRGPGLAKWAESPKPWTTLVAHLTKYVGPLKARIYASRWFYEIFHFYAGSDLNRVTHGQPPRGHRVGPG